MRFQEEDLRVFQTLWQHPVVIIQPEFIGFTRNTLLKACYKQDSMLQGNSTAALYGAHCCKRALGCNGSVNLVSLVRYYRACSIY